MDTPSNNYRLVIVDDEPIVHRMINRIVEQSDLPIAVAGAFSSGAAALEASATLRPDMFVLDIQMDGMDGLELAASITDVLGHKPVIVYLTAHRRFEYAQEAVRLGAIEYLVKPIRRTDLLAALGKAISVLQAARLDHLEKEHLKKQLGAVLPAAVTETGPAEETRRASIVRAGRQFVEDHYAEPISLTEVAEHINLSPGYLGSMFKAEYGITLRAYLRRVRVARAKELMRDPRLNLTEIAQRVGFEDISYFSQCFLEEAGVRPSEYRGGGRYWPR